jgi:hypothetical protein
VASVFFTFSDHARNTAAHWRVVLMFFIPLDNSASRPRHPIGPSRTFKLVFDL